MSMYVAKAQGHVKVHGERACMQPYRACTDGKMLMVAEFRIACMHPAGLGRSCHSLIRKLLTLSLETASILPSVQTLWDLHALSPPLVGQYYGLYVTVKKRCTILTRYCELFLRPIVAS